jgi:phosphoserine phosphatase
MTAVATDLEGTLTTGETWRVLGEYLKTHGYALRYRVFFFSRLPGALLARGQVINGQRFRERWFEGMTELLAGLNRAQIDELMETIVEELWRYRRDDVLDEIARHRERGARIIVASGAYEQVVQGFAQRIGADAIGTSMQFDAVGRATGEIAAISTGEVKAARVREALNGAALIAAYGDTEGDVPMLTMAAEPVAVYPDPVLRAEALRRGWRLIGEE